VAFPEDFAVGDLSSLVNPSPLYTVLSATQSQMDAGLADLVDSVYVTFTVTGRTGVFSVELPSGGWRVFENGLDLTSEADIVNELYGL
jgi:hypothetical protein